MITVLHVSYQTRPHVEPLGAEQVAEVLTTRGHLTQFISTSLSGSLDDSLLSGLVNGDCVIFAGLNNVRDILDQNGSERNRIASRLRELGFQGTLVALGHQVSLTPQAILEGCDALDAVIVGDCDTAAELIADHLDSSRPLQGVLRPISAQPNSSARGWLAYGLLGATQRRPYLRRLIELHPPGRVAAVIESSRGCSHSRCTFCSTAALRGLLSRPAAILKPIDLVVAEIEFLAEEWGVRRFVVEDDFAASPSRGGEARLASLATRLAQLPEPIEFSLVLRPDTINARTRPTFEALKRVGLRLIYLGLESFLQSDLELFDKRLTVSDLDHALDVAATLGFGMGLTSHLRIKPGMMPFHPYTTLQGLAAQVPLLERHSITPIKMLAEVELFQGTPLHVRAERDGLLAPGTRSGFRYLHREVTVLHDFARDVLRTIHAPRKRIRDIEKTIAGFGLPLETAARLRGVRVGLEQLFDAAYVEGLRHCLGGGDPAGLERIADDATRQVEELLESTGYREQSDRIWAEVLERIRPEYRSLPDAPDPAFFRPCWFPVVH